MAEPQVQKKKRRKQQLSTLEESLQPLLASVIK
jgi:hypothetical protein